jgi:hypothetical protein
MYADADGLLSRCELRAVLASFFLEHCQRAIREDAAALSAALSAALDPQNSGYIVTDGTCIHTYIHTYIHIVYVFIVNGVCLYCIVIRHTAILFRHRV